MPPLSSKYKKGKITHGILNEKFRSLGTAIHKGIKIAGTVTQLKTPSGFKSDPFQRIVDEAISGRIKEVLSSKKFGSRYRTRLEYHDELISTSAVREILRGLVEQTVKKSLSKTESDRLQGLLDNVSKVRILTKYSGFATKWLIMQHPTSEGEGLFGDPKKTAKLHSALDLERKTHIEARMREEMNKQGATAQSIVEAGLRAAISFTLNKFTAPVTASDVFPYTAAGKAKTPKTSEPLLEQVRGRERIKGVFRRIGGTQEKPGAGGTAFDRPWGDRQDQQLDTVSPERMTPSAKNNSRQPKAPVLTRVSRGTAVSYFTITPAIDPAGAN